MSNPFSYDARRDIETLWLNNMLTSILMEDWSAAAARLAATEREKELACWIAGHDYTVHGMGLCGFDLSELPWSHDSFEPDRDFFLKTIAAARERFLHDERLTDFLDRLSTMVQSFALAHAAPADKLDWPKPASFELCPMHAIYKHAYGCLRCNAIDDGNNSRDIQKSLTQPRRIKTTPWKPPESS
ncbi:MAG: hypothetical protein NTY77_08355 [Elusimicrobia bacterium]|nr:hypothetical protein [Elusimicrobiota bacterium]